MTLVLLCSIRAQFLVQVYPSRNLSLWMIFMLSFFRPWITVWEISLSLDWFSFYLSWKSCHYLSWKSCRSLCGETKNSRGMWNWGTIMPQNNWTDTLRPLMLTIQEILLMHTSAQCLKSVKKANVQLLKVKCKKYWHLGQLEPFHTRRQRCTFFYIFLWSEMKKKKRVEWLPIIPFTLDDK